ncbi:MAG: response regulator transcription factor [Ruminococcaceae bacterium]|nr:response regulator transcription factor [Oscillospiraceae bacterium]
MRVLIVEDEQRIANALCRMMESCKYACDVVYDGLDGYLYAESDIYDLIILDIMLPRMDGIEIAKQLRAKKIKTPILMLTAKSETEDKVKGLDSGADDYMTKPFSKEELLARVRALTRRKGEVILDELRYDDLVLNLSSYTLSKDEKTVRLGLKEFEILKILMSNPKRVTQKEDLIIKVWGYDSDAEDNNVEVYISFLRKKLSFLNSKVVISTARKIGYYLEVSP